MHRTLVIFALVVLVFCIASSIDTNRYISAKYPDDQKLNNLKAPLAGLIIAAAALALSFIW